MKVATLNNLNDFLQGIKSNFAKLKHTHELSDITDFSINAIEILKLAYPIGSVYISTSTAPPSELFGFGEWEAIKDTFLLSAGDDYTVGQTGGEAEHTLTIQEMPSHNHRLKTDIQNPAYNVTWSEWFEYTDGWTQEAGETEAPATHTTSTGGSMAHNNMPPYLVVYMWKRIA